MEPQYFIGLDFGKTSEFTALAVLERPPTDLAEHSPSASSYFLRHLHRWPIGTSYGFIVRHVAELAGMHPLDGNSTLVADQTAVGEPLIEMLRRREPVPARIVPVTITGGHVVAVAEDGLTSVPKLELVSSLQLLLQGRRLHVARILPDAETLVSELQTFRVKTTTVGNESFELWRERIHDDLVLAVGLACWLGEREPRWGEIADSEESDSLMAKLPRGVFASDLM